MWGSPKLPKDIAEPMPASIPYTNMIIVQAPCEYGQMTGLQLGLKAGHRVSGIVTKGMLLRAAPGL